MPAITVSWKLPATSHAGAVSAAKVRVQQNSTKPTALQRSQAIGWARIAACTGATPPCQGISASNRGKVKK